MSDSLAIAAVTATLRNLLENGIKDSIPDINVSTLPPDKVAQNNSGNQLNIFLYQTRPNAAWRNMDMPHQVKPGETGFPPLALNLHYLLSAYGKDNDIDAHKILGLAALILHDHAELTKEEIKNALEDNDLHEQCERVRITPDDLSLDDLSKIWNTFQTQYRISAPYRASVVLIESERPRRTPLPVLTRGKDDAGIQSQPDLISPFPTIESVILPKKQPAAQLEDVLTLKGHHLDGDSQKVRFVNTRLTDPIDIAPLAGATATEIKVKIPDDPDNWPIGFYSVSVVISKAGEQNRRTNEMTFALAPKILDIDPPNPVNRDAAGNVTLEITLKPNVQAEQEEPFQPKQSASLLLGDREICADTITAATNKLTFNIQNAQTGFYYVRLRIDGVDSLLIVDRSATPPKFDDELKVEIR